MDQLIQRLLKFTGDGVYRYTWDEGKILLANEGLVKILDLDCAPEAIVGRPLRELMVYTEREGTVRKALEQRGEIHGFVYHFRTLKGADKWVIHDSFVGADAGTGAKVVDAIVKDITAMKRAEDALAAERERLAVTIQSIGDAVIATDERGVVMVLNRVAEELTGWTEAQAIGQPLARVFHIINEKTREVCEDPVAKVIKTGLIIGLANHTVLVARDGRERIIADSGAPIRAANGATIGAVLVFRNVTEQRAAELALRESEAMLRTIVENMPIALFAVDRKGVFTLSEGANMEELGLSPGRIVGRTVEGVYRELPRLRENLGEALQGRAFSSLAQVGGATFEIWYAPYRDPEGGVAGVVGVATDITERQRAAEELRISLREKEVLLKEIHHRVKNNMQVIHSLLSLQAQHTRDPHALEVLTDSQNRVRSMALVHEKLYQSRSLAQIDFGDYAHKLATDLLRTYRIAPQAIVLEVQIDPVDMSIETAIPCGLIINELMANSLKHAFAGKPTGTIRLELRARGPRLVLSVGDNGKGFPKDFDLHKTQSLGLQLVNTLVQQLEGKLTIEHDGGTTIRIAFPRAKTAEARAPLP
jgi:PAS domain S-box-containing protein